MSNYPNAVQLASTITLGASGGSDSASVLPALANAPFTDLSISIVPMSKGSVAYTVEVYHDGELLETHTFPDATTRTVCHLSYPNFIFPANIGTNTIAKYFAASESDYPGVPIRLVISNTGREPQTFLVYAMFKEFETARFGIVHQE